MKRIFCISLMLTTIFALVSIQNIQAQGFEKGHLGISPGINLGGVGFYRGGSGLPIVASGEFGILDMLGVGPYAGFVNYSFGSGASKYSYRFITFGVRGDFHYTDLLAELLEADLDAEKLDLYAALLLGYQTVSYSGADGTFFRGLYSNRVNTGLAIGGRFYFNEKFGVFAEVGRVLYGALNVGVTVKLK